MERLDDVVVGAGAQALDPLAHVRLGGEHDDRHAPPIGLRGADLLGGGVAIQLGHGHVHQDQVGLRVLRHRHAGLAVGGDDHLEALLLEGEDQDALDIQVVIDDEDLRGSHARTLAAWCVRTDRRGAAPGAIIRAPPRPGAAARKSSTRRSYASPATACASLWAAPSTTISSFGSLAASYSRTAWVQSTSRSSRGAISSSPRGAICATRWIGCRSERPRPNRGGSHHQPRPEPRERIASLAHAVGDRVREHGIGGIGHHRGHRQVRCGHDRHRAAHADPHQADRSVAPALQEADGRRDVALLKGAQGDRRVIRVAVAAEVELQDVVARLDPRHELGQPRQAVPAEAVHQDHRRPRVSRAAGISQPSSVKPSSVVKRTSS